MLEPISMTIRLRLLLGCIGLMVLGCGEPDESRGANAMPAQGAQGVRIASLSPAMTTMVNDLGMGEFIVGSTPFCRGLDAPVAVVGSLTDVDAELLLRTRPTLLLVQPAAGGVDPALVALAQRHGISLVAQRLDSLADVQRALRAIGEALGTSLPQARVDGLCREIAGLTAPDQPGGPRTVLLYAVDPLGAAGSGTYLDEILRAAGGRNALLRDGWLELSEEELLALQPEAIVLLGTSRGEALGSLPWKIAPQIHHLDAPDAMEPSSRAIAVVEQLRSTLEESP